jgi:prepilin-type N-terminal cleavage/methylation domain-containing protein
MNTRNRGGFTLLESMAALGVLATAAVLAAQIGTWSLIERGRTHERLTAMDEVANIMEAARAKTWAELTPEWAAAQTLSASAADRLKDGTLSVRVVPEPDRPRVKSVTVELRWDHRPSIPAQTVTLVGLFAERSAGGAT